MLDLHSCHLLQLRLKFGSKAPAIAPLAWSTWQKAFLKWNGRSKETCVFFKGKNRLLKFQKCPTPTWALAPGWSWFSFPTEFNKSYCQKPFGCEPLPLTWGNSTFCCHHRLVPNQRTGGGECVCNFLQFWHTLHFTHVRYKLYSSHSKSIMKVLHAASHLSFQNKIIQTVWQYRREK